MTANQKEKKKKKRKCCVVSAERSGISPRQSGLGHCMPPQGPKKPGSGNWKPMRVSRESRQFLCIHKQLLFQGTQFLNKALKTKIPQQQNHPSRRKINRHTFKQQQQEIKTKRGFNSSIRLHPAQKAEAQPSPAAPPPPARPAPCPGPRRGRAASIAAYLGQRRRGRWGGRRLRWAGLRAGGAGLLSPPAGGGGGRPGGCRARERSGRPGMRGSGCAAPRERRSGRGRPGEAPGRGRGRGRAGSATRAAAERRPGLRAASGRALAERERSLRLLPKEGWSRRCGRERAVRCRRQHVWQPRWCRGCRPAVTLGGAATAHPGWCKEQRCLLRASRSVEGAPAERNTWGCGQRTLLDLLH